MLKSNIRKIIDDLFKSSKLSELDKEKLIKEIINKKKKCLQGKDFYLLYMFKYL